MEKLIKKIKENVRYEKPISYTQMSLTIIAVITLIISNIIVVKTINLFGLVILANTCATLTYPITYVLSDVFSEVYGYKWSRKVATWAAVGTLLCSVFFALTIIVPGNQEWTNQSALVSILGNTPKIAVASVLAFWFGDLVNDKIFEKMKKKHGKKHFSLRAIVSSLGGEYTDSFIFTFIGLSFLPFTTKLIMVLNAPLIQLGIECLCLPISNVLKNKLYKIEGK